MARKPQRNKSKAARSTIISKLTGKHVDRKRSLAARKAAATRKANLRKETKRSALRLHHKIIAAGAIIAVLVLAFLGIRNQLQSFATTASAQGFLHGSGRCMDNAGNHRVNGNPIRIWNCNATEAQTWKISSDGTIRNADGYCLGTSGSVAAVSEYASLRPCSTSTTLKWTYSGGHLYNQYSHYCLGTYIYSSRNGTRLQIQHCGTTPMQKWTYKVVTVTVTAPSMSAKQSLAKYIVDSGKVSWLGGDGVSSAQQKKIFSDIADGVTSGDSWPCGLNIKVLELVKLIVSKHSSVGISDTNSRCVGLNIRSIGSRHYGGNGSAVDFYMLDGTLLNGSNSKSIQLLEEAKSSLSQGSSLHYESQVGQSECRSYVDLGHVIQFSDYCNHVHIDFPPWADPHLRYASYAY